MKTIETISDRVLDILLENSKGNYLGFTVFDKRLWAEKLWRHYKKQKREYETQQNNDFRK